MYFYEICNDQLGGSYRRIGEEIFFSYGKDRVDSIKSLISTLEGLL